MRTDYRYLKKELHITGNTVGLIGGMALAENKRLEILEVGIQGNVSVGLALANNTTLKELSVGGLAINDAIISAFSQNQHLENLGIWHAPLLPKHAKMLAKNNRLHTLNISGYVVHPDEPLPADHFPGIGDEGAIALANNTTLKHLILMAEDLTPLSMTAFAQNTTLKSLRLDFNPDLGDEGLLQLSSSHSQLETLIMYFCKIGPRGVENITNMKQLKTLDLSANHIGDKGAASIAEHTGLENLTLGLNNIGDEGAVSLAQNSTLSYVELIFNRIGFIGVNALKNNKYFKTLVVDYQLGQKER